MSAPSTPLLVLLLLAAGTAAHGLYLWWLVARDLSTADAAAAALASATPEADASWIWHAVPADCGETKLVLAYERETRHRVLQYPTIQPARHVRFTSGAVHLMTESALERTLEADDALRDRLGLDPVDEV